MKDKECKSLAALLAVMLLAGCNSPTEAHTDKPGTISVPPIISSKSIVSEDEPETSESGEAPDASEPADTSEAASNESVPKPQKPVRSDKEGWSEFDYNAELFVRSRVMGREAPLDTAAATREYKADEPVTVVAFTSTRFFKLSNGDYIFAEYLNREKGYTPETVKTELSYTPPEVTNGNTRYDRRKALDYAREHWQEDESLCAGFGTECLTAGGLDFDESSSTKLYNKLVEAKLGYSVMIDLNEDGTANVPDFVYPGDVIFYYCKDENMMVHTAIYNGDTKDGVMKAYAHNLADDGESPFRYFEYCVSGCNCALDKIVAFCFYRDERNAVYPTSTPKLSAELSDDSAVISWTTDFVYRSSELVLTDGKGKILSRQQMGTDKSETLRLNAGESYSVYVVFTVSGGVRVRSDELKL